MYLSKHLISSALSIYLFINFCQGAPSSSRLKSLNSAPKSLLHRPALPAGATWGLQELPGASELLSKTSKLLSRASELLSMAYFGLLHWLPNVIFIRQGQRKTHFLLKCSPGPTCAPKSLQMTFLTRLLNPAFSILHALRASSGGTLIASGGPRGSPGMPWTEPKLRRPETLVTMRFGLFCRP